MTHTHLYAQREMALMELSKKREVFPDLAPILWHTVGTMAALLQVGKWVGGSERESLDVAV
jgi:hypothetical protein